MKKYLWITMYFVWLVLMSYSFFYFSGKRKKFIIIKSSDKIEKKVDVSNNTNNYVTTWSITSNHNKDNNESISWFDIVLKKIENDDFTWENLSWSNNLDKKKEVDINKMVKIWKVVWQLVNKTSYDDIFELLWYWKTPTYKIKNKYIYIKILKTVDYENEKNNINQLIQKIWGNIKETNLFGDKQIFINPDIYYGKTVIMLVKHMWKLYFVVLPYKYYKEYKLYLSGVLFTNN